MKLNSILYLVIFILFLATVYWGITSKNLLVVGENGYSIISSGNLKRYLDGIDMDDPDNIHSIVLPDKESVIQVKIADWQNRNLIKTHHLYAGISFEYWDLFSDDIVSIDILDGLRYLQEVEDLPENFQIEGQSDSSTIKKIDHKKMCELQKKCSFDTNDVIAEAVGRQIGFLGVYNNKMPFWVHSSPSFPVQSSCVRVDIRPFGDAD